MFKSIKSKVIGQTEVVTGSKPNKEYPKDKVNDPATDSKNKNVRDLYRVEN
jgi:hypothetical protein